MRSWPNQKSCWEQLFEGSKICRRERGGLGGGGQQRRMKHLFAEEGFRERENFRGISSSSSTFALLSWRFLLRLKEKQRPSALVTSQKKRKKLPKSS